MRTALKLPRLFVIRLETDEAELISALAGHVLAGFLVLDQYSAPGTTAEGRATADRADNLHGSRLQVSDPRIFSHRAVAVSAVATSSSSYRRTAPLPQTLPAEPIDDVPSERRARPTLDAERRLVWIAIRPDLTRSGAPDESVDAPEGSLRDPGI